MSRRPPEQSATLSWWGTMMLVGLIGWVSCAAWTGWVLGGGWWIGAVAGPASSVIVLGLWLWTMMPSARRDADDQQVIIITMATTITLLSAWVGLFVWSLGASVLVALGHSRRPRGRKP